MSSTKIESRYHQTLLELAHKAIDYGLEYGKEMAVHTEDFPPPLREHRATFVTLKIAGELRGCIGTLAAYRPLVEDVVGNAYAAAFSDPRFPAVIRKQLANINISISILSPSEELVFKDESDLLDQLCPGTDGLILQDGVHRGTFLPSVWESLPDKLHFLKQLKLKAGLPVDYWSDHIRVFRYTTQMIDHG